MDYFKNFVGYNSLKDQLTKIAGWIQRREEFNSKGIDVPRGILFYGNPGNGKSLLVKEFIRMFQNGDNIFSIVGDEDRNFVKEITAKFKKAREVDGLSIIVIDEIDLIVLDPSAYRSLLSELEGINDNKNVFVLATTNKRRELPGALIRKGRFDYLIGVDYPSFKERTTILNHYYDVYGVDTTNIDKEYIARASINFSSAELKSLVNEIVLNYGNNPTEEEANSIVDQINGFTLYGGTEEIKDITIAYHEVGHALIGYLNSKYYHFYRASLGVNQSIEGLCKITPRENYINNIDSITIDIEINLAGYLTTRYFFHKVDVGSSIDLEKASASAYQLVNEIGYGGACRITRKTPSEYKPTYIKLRQNEIVMKRIINKCKRKVMKSLRKYKNEVIILANKLYKDGSVNERDFDEVFKNNTHQNNELDAIKSNNSFSNKEEE